MAVYVSLIHYPVYNKEKRVVATSLTTLDIHDIARSSRTYGVKGYYIVQPIENHLWLANKLLSFWQGGHGREYNPKRWEALKLVKAVPYIEDAISDIEKVEGKKPYIVSTSAKRYEHTISFRDLKSKIENEDVPFLICFGTGWGLTEEFIESSDFILEPICGPTNYNHLSVRSAASIILDRLLGLR
ncbi:RNA methyltransferase [Desulfurobacterium sp. TC5-1]|uniref:RNA methyltransferase n=1 Tax=Desulfurobacterium sp. TC5-1 TaxID=1158318 RepID=UPI0003B6958A|nr:RNA methyltransferase [Desulfurobacterium sp. TC5-1]